MIKTKSDAVDLIYASYNAADEKAIRNQQATRKLLDDIGSPDLGQAIVLVTGSKGKGSTAMFISSLLQANGYKTGLFTSPHYYTFNERIQVNGQAISDADFIRLAAQIAPFANNRMNELTANEYLGPIGVALAIALLYFKEQNVDYIILEAGKGGKFDDTNVVHNQWAVITPILNEHIDELGPTISQVIAHKLGIIKKDSTAFISKQQLHVKQKIKQLLPSGKKTYMYGEDFSLLSSTVSRKGTFFHFYTTRKRYNDMFVPLLGAFQCENISLAVQTCEVILNKTLNHQLVQHWLNTLQNPGKCELLSENPTIIADAAINEQSAKYLREIVAYFAPKNTLLIAGLSNDKDYKGVIQTLLPVSRKMLISKPYHGYKAFDEQKIFQIASHLLSTDIAPSLQEAVKHVLTQNEHDLILIVGNHSFIAEAKQYFLTQQ